MDRNYQQNLLNLSNNIQQASEIIPVDIKDQIIKALQPIQELIRIQIEGQQKKNQNLKFDLFEDSSLRDFQKIIQASISSIRSFLKSQNLEESKVKVIECINAFYAKKNYVFLKQSLKKECRNSIKDIYNIFKKFQSIDKRSQLNAFIAKFTLGTSSKKSLTYKYQKVIFVEKKNKYKNQFDGVIRYQLCNYFEFINFFATLSPNNFLKELNANLQGYSMNDIDNLIIILPNCICKKLNNQHNGQLWNLLRQIKRVKPNIITIVDEYKNDELCQQIKSGLDSSQKIKLLSKLTQEDISEESQEEISQAQMDNLTQYLNQFQIYSDLSDLYFSQLEELKNELERRELLLEKVLFLIDQKDCVGQLLKLSNDLGIITSEEFQLIDNNITRLIDKGIYPTQLSNIIKQSVAAEKLQNYFDSFSMGCDNQDERIQKAKDILESLVVDENKSNK